MDQSIYQIALIDLLWIAIPVVIVVIIFVRWSLKISSVLQGFCRMFIQLILIGYGLNFIFKVNQSLIIVGILTIMLIAAGLISLRPVKQKGTKLYFKAFFAIMLGSVFTLVIIIQGVINVSPWYKPHYIIPLAGMIFASSMNAVSLAAERFEVEYDRKADYQKARATALRAALIPITNSLFAVGIVSLPGMMTGQILSGISPLIAARYQIMVMCMMFGAAGISAALYLRFLQTTLKQHETDHREP